MVTEPLEEVLIISELERVIRRHFLIRKRKKRRRVMKPLFVHTPDRPLAGLLETAAGALAAGYAYRDACFGIRFFED